MRRHPRPVLNTAPPEPCESVNPQEEPKEPEEPEEPDEPEGPEACEPPAPEMPIGATTGDPALNAEPEVVEPAVSAPLLAESPEETTLRGSTGQKQDSILIPIEFQDQQ